MSARERAIEEWSRGDALAAWMLRHGIPVTRENYIDCAFAGLDEPTEDEYAEFCYAMPDFLND